MLDSLVSFSVHWGSFRKNVRHAARIVQCCTVIVQWVWVWVWNGEEGVSWNQHNRRLT